MLKSCLNAGFAAKLKPLIDRAISSALAENRIVGGVAAVASEGNLVYWRAAGMADRENKVPMRTDTIFRLSSVTKPIVAIAAMRLVECGRFGLEDEVTKWLPYFRPILADGRMPVITIRHLLAHTAGLGSSFIASDDGPNARLALSAKGGQRGESLDEDLRRLSGAPLLYEPGRGWGYSISMDVLGGVIEKEMGSSLGDAVACLVTQPLGLQDTAFHLSDRRRVAVPYKSGSDNPERMQAEDFVESPTGMIRFANERIFDPLSYHSGGGGMAGTAGDILAILEVIRKGGAPLLHRETVEVMIQDQSHGLMSAERPGQGFGIGWAVVTDPVKAALPYSRGTIQWGGVYGHSWFVDREKAITVVMLTNTAPEGLFGRYATDVRDAVYAALD